MRVGPTSVVVAGRRPPVVVVSPVLVIPVPVAVVAVVVVTVPAAATAAAAETEAGPGRLAVVEVDPGRGPVGRRGDAEVHADLEPRDLRPVQSVARLLRVLHGLEVDEREASGPLGGTIQHHVYLFYLPKSTKLSVQISFCSCEIETKNTQTFGRGRVFSVSVHLRIIYQ